MNFKILVCFILLSFNSFNYIFSQQHIKIDSLTQLLDEANDSSKIDILLDLSWELRNSELQSAIKYGIQGIGLAKKHKLNKQLCDAYTNTGVAYRNIGSYDLALESYIKGLIVAQRNGLQEKEGYARINIANLYIYINDFENAKTYIDSALIISESIPNKNMQAYCYLNRSRIMLETKNFNQAILNLKKALTIRKEINNISGQSVCYKYLGDVYYAMEQYSQALTNYSNTIDIARQSNDFDLLCDVYNNIALVYLKEENLPKANEYAIKSLNHSLNIKAKLRIRNAYETLAEIEKRNKNFEKASNYQNMIILYNDSLFTTQLSEKLSYYEFVNEQMQLEQNIRDSDIIHQLELKRLKQVKNLSLVISLVLFIGIIFVARYFILKHKTKQKIIEQNNKLMELNATKDKFFSIIAHDLRSPFSAIIGYSQMLHSSFESFSNEEIKKYIGQIFQSSKNTFNLLENLLMWANSQKETLNFNQTEVEINGLVDEIILLLNDAAHGKGIKINNLITNTFAVFADVDMLNFVIRNLISNAIKFTPRGGTINVVLNDIKNDFATISIEDDGVGIEKENLTHLFRIQKSHSTLGTENEKGTGLGLIVCKEFVEKHGGVIWVKSEKDKGSCFYFTVPNFT